MTFWKYQKIYPSHFFLLGFFFEFFLFIYFFFFNPCIDDRWSVKSLNGFNNNSFLLQHFAKKTSNDFITGVLGFKLFQSPFFMWTSHSGKSSFWSPSMICPRITIFISILITTSTSNKTMHGPSSWSSSHAILASETAWDFNYHTSC